MATVILALGTSADSSTSVTLAAGETAWVGVYWEGPRPATPFELDAEVQLSTPGGTWSTFKRLTWNEPATSVTAPTNAAATIRIRRGASSAPLGAFRVGGA
jgi:hypothetical protein